MMILCNRKLCFQRTKFPHTMVEIWRGFCWYGLRQPSHPRPTKNM